MFIGIAGGCVTSQRAVAGGGSSSFVPSSITGLKFWVDASQGVTVDGSNNVASWSDLSGNGGTLSQGTFSQRPAYVTASKNGLPTVNFDGISELLTGSDASLPTGTSARTMIWAGTFSSLPNNFGGWSYGANSANQTFGLVKFSGTVSPTLTTQGWGTDYQSTYTIVANTYFIYVVLFQTGANGLTQRVNKAAAGTTTSIQNTVRQNIRMGAETNNTGFVPIKVCECLIYDSVLSGSNLTNVENYLSTKWAI